MVGPLDVTETSRRGAKFRLAPVNELREDREEAVRSGGGLVPRMEGKDGWR